MKFASAFMVTAEIAFYFGALLLIRIFQPLAMAMLLFTGLVFVCMFLAELLRKIWPLRILLLIIPAGALLIAPVDMKLILFFPPFVYALLTAALDRFYREHWRYVLVYKALFVIALVLVLISLIGNPDKYTSFYHTLVFIGIFYLFGITGLRMIRTGSGGAKWRLYNAAGVFLPAAAVGLSAAGIVFLLSRVKNIFSILAYPLTGLMWLVLNVMQKIFGKVAEGIDPQELAPVAEDTVESAAEQIETASAAEGGDWFIPVQRPDIRWEIVLPVLFVLVTGIVMLFIFRNKAEEAADNGDEIAGGRRYRVFRRRRNGGRKHPTPADEVRASYRSYLTLLQLRGVDIVPAETSLDILGYAAEETRDEEEKLRRLYIRARYAGEATREEAAEAARIVAFIRQQR